MQERAMHGVHQVVEGVAPRHFLIGVAQEARIFRRDYLRRRLEVAGFFMQRVGEPNEDGAGDFAARIGLDRLLAFERAAGWRDSRS